MTPDKRNPVVTELLEEILDTGAAPRDVCRDHPELLAEVEARLARVRAFEVEMERLLPSGGASGSGPTGRPGSLPPGLPAIPGYAMESVVGYGGAGVVYKARHLRLNRTVAVKMLLAGAYAGPHELERFRREAESIAGLRHPNIVQLYDAGDWEGRPYFTMEFMDGGSLGAALAGTPQHATKAAGCLAALARAVQVAHSSGIVHRDLKPGNILIAADGTPKIADFGLARRLERDPALTLSAAGVGTPSYMAPEQAAGTAEGLCTPVDIYALGAILYDMLTGRPPFRAETPVETQRQVVYEEPAPPSRLNVKVPLDLETICLKCLHKDPRRRYETAAALADDLERFLRHEPVTARRVGAIGRAYKWTRRRPARAAFLVAGMLAAGSMASAALWIGSQRAAINRAVHEDLVELAKREADGRWKDARDLLERATTRLGASGAEGLRARLDAARRDLDLVARLDEIRFSRASSTQPRFDRAGIGRRYAAAFADSGLMLPEEPVHDAARRIAASPVKAALVEALDDWILSGTTDLGVVQRLLNVARLADPDPAWRDQVRSPRAFTDPARLRRLAGEADAASQPVSLLMLVASLLHDIDADESLVFMRRVQRAHPGDFFVNFLLGELCDRRDDPDAIAFYRAALAARPGAVAALTNLGLSLERHGRPDEAIACWQDALARDPDSMVTLSNLALAYFERRDLDRAEPVCRDMVRLHPGHPLGHGLLGQTLMLMGRFGEARDALTRSAALAPEDDPARAGCTRLAERCRRFLLLDDRLAGITEGSDAPSDNQEWFDIAELLNIRKNHAAAAAFYARAFDANPQVAQNPPDDLRPSAAMATLKASVEPGAEAPTLRARALAWMGAELGRWRQRLASGDPAARDGARAAARIWRIDPAFNVVRDSGALAALPPLERAEWSNFWFEVDVLFARSQTPQPTGHPGGTP